MKVLKWKKYGLNIIGFVIGRIILYGMNPIAMGFFAANYVEKQGRMTMMIFVLMGMLTSLAEVEVAKYCVVMIAVSIVIALLEYNHKKVSVGILGGLTAGITTALTISNGFLNIDTGYYIWIGLVEGIITFATCFLFRKGLEPILHTIKGQSMDNEQMISVAILLGAFIYGVPNFETVGFSLTMTLVLFAIIFTGYKYGAGYGAVAGVSCGIVLWIRGSSVNEIALLCMLGIIAGIFRELGRFITFSMYVVGVIVLEDLFQQYGENLTLIGALVSCGILFLLLPKAVIYKVYESQSKDIEDLFVKQSIQNIAKGKLRDFSESFYNLSHTFATLSDKKSYLSKQDKHQIFEDLSDCLCKECELCGDCWKHNFYDSYQGVNYMLDMVEKNGTIDVLQVPKEFATRCTRIERYVFEVIWRMEKAKLNLAWYNRMAEGREAIAGQLNEVANIIDDFSMDLYKTVETSETRKRQIIYELRTKQIVVNRLAIFEKRNSKQEIYMSACTERGRCITTKEASVIIGKAFGKRMRPQEGCKNVISKELETFVFVEDVNYTVFTGMSKITKEGGKISGDNYSFIYPDPGTVAMTLSDGMGTGEVACEESESVVELLEQFIEAGFRKESAIKLINSILVLKSEEQTFSTIDISILNLYTGVCDIIKMGAATTFIKRDKEVETITSTTLPVGILNHVDYDVISKNLYNGDFVIMVTDGVMDCIPFEEKEVYLENLLLTMKIKNPKDMADAILNKALEWNGGIPRDDMTVLVSGFWEK